MCIFQQCRLKEGGCPLQYASSNIDQLCMVFYQCNDRSARLYKAYGGLTNISRERILELCKTYAEDLIESKIHY